MAKKLEELVENADIVIPDPPMVRETPEGWPSLFTMEGETWYERALAYEAWSGHKPLPTKWVYDENWNIVPANLPDEPLYAPDGTPLTGGEEDGSR